MAKVSIRNLTKRFDSGQAALEGVSIEIASGEFVVLVGPSGCGKSTLLRSIAGLETPSEGSIGIGDRVVDALPPAERGIGMVFQYYALYPHMSVRQNLEFGLRLRKLPREDTRHRVEEIAGMLDLLGLLERKPSQLSGGQRQRVAIGRALVKQPSVLLLDEPLSNLDAQLRAQTRIEIAALHRRIGSTTIYVTHDQEEAMTLADRIMVLEKGRVQQVDTPMGLYEKPVNRFVASFIGSPRMNFVESEGIEAPPGVSGPFVLGFRPETAWISDRGFRAKALMIEHHGHESHLIAQAGESRIVLRASDPEKIQALRGLAPGAEIGIDIDLSRAHWFDPVSGRSLSVE